MLKGTAREAAAEFFGTFIPIALASAWLPRPSQQERQRLGPLHQHRLVRVMFRHLHIGGRVWGVFNPAVTVALAAPRSSVEQGRPLHDRPDRGRICRVGARLCDIPRSLVRLRRRRAMVEGATATAYIFATHPQPFLSIAAGSSIRSLAPCC